MADDQLMDQDGIEKLLASGKDMGAPTPPQQPPTPPQQPAATDSASQALDQSEIESLLGGGTAAEQPQAAAQTPQAAPAAEEEILGQGGVEKMLQEAGAALSKPGARSAGTDQPASDLRPGEGSMLPGDTDFLLQQAEQALESINSASAGDLPEGISQFHLEEFSGALASTETATFDLVRDVELDLKIELGRTHMYLEDVLKLRKGSVVPLDKLAGDPVDIYVNGRLIARGEVLVLSDNFCVRVAELIAGTSTSA